MAYWVFGVELLALTVLVFLVLREFISFRRTAWYAIGSTYVGWLLCFSIVFFLPLDISNADYEVCLDAPHNQRCHQPWSYINPYLMELQWRILYWGNFFLSWLIFPILQSYWLAGDFTFGDRLFRAVKENLVLYAILGCIGIAIVSGLAASGQWGWQELLSTVMFVANAYGLVLVVLLMGYGLVDIPRYFLFLGSRDRTMRDYYLQAAILHDSLEEASSELTKTLRLVKKISEKVKDNDPYRPYVDTILRNCPAQYDNIKQGEGDTALSYEKLATLHTKIKDNMHSAERAAILYEMLIKHAHEHEDIMASRGASDHVVHWSFKKPRDRSSIANTFEYIWFVYLYPWACRLAFLLTAAMSLAIIWCEVILVYYKTSGTNLSPFSLFLSYYNVGGILKQILCFIPLFYMTMCAYTSLFKLRIFNYYRLVRHNMSDANSIMFSANYLSRLAAPLAYNYLQGIVCQNDPAFSNVMGDMDATSSQGEFGAKFRAIFPVFVVVVCLMALFRIFSRVAACCCIKSLRYSTNESPATIERGRALLADSRNRRPTNSYLFGPDIKRAVLARYTPRYFAPTILIAPQVTDDEIFSSPTPGAHSTQKSTLVSSGSFTNFGSASNPNRSNPTTNPYTAASTSASNLRYDPHSRSNLADARSDSPTNLRAPLVSTARPQLAPSYGSRSFGGGQYDVGSRPFYPDYGK
eukprot:TRINITY_DN3337_c0_g1_i2.p1 TRINITY_DN3337_c0_g1~~TRINITY_DN3337_c0_g1_i2.p1  ORF type:complete len:694 (+),score=70.00 TRINITY_DN3337_c0_g1_i2:220-2301(+)